MVFSLSRAGRYWQDVASGLASRPGGYLRALRWLAMYALARIVAVRRIVRSLSRHDAVSVLPGTGPSMFLADAAGIGRASCRERVYACV